MKRKLSERYLWNASKIAMVTRGNSNGDWSVNGISIDSRTIEKGDLFIAIKGPNHDGHNYVEQALAKGAVGAVVGEDYVSGLEITPDLSRFVSVADTMTALNDIAISARNRSEARIIAITGSVGKTSTKEALKLALDATVDNFSNVYATKGNLNNHWGLPLSLAHLPRDAAYGIFEIGMNHGGEISPLSRMARPHVAVVTNVADTHSENFDSLDQIANAKAEIFDGLTTDGVAILNRDNSMFQHLSIAARSAGVNRIYSFGSVPGADCRLVDMQLNPNSSDITAEIEVKRIVYSLGVPGRHLVINSLAVLCALHSVGTDILAGVDALTKFEGLKGRGKRHRIDLGLGIFELIDESYNASPASMAAAIEVLAARKAEGGGRKIAVLGDMLELGAESETLHAALVESLIRSEIELVFTAGQFMSALWDALPVNLRGGHSKTVENLIPMITTSIEPGDIVMVKGSLGSRMYGVVDALLEQGGEGMRYSPRLVKGG